jgi:hypothetical protein
MKRLFAYAVLPLLLACARQPALVNNFQSEPPPNPKAPMAFFGEGNLEDATLLEYATALQNAGLYNFVFENFSEEQIVNGVEIRLNYKEEHKRLNHIPVLMLSAEFLRNGETFFKFIIKEENHRTVFTPVSHKKEKKFSKQLLLQRFLEEVKKTTSKEEDSCCKA